jgi:hypothetical protein
MREYGSVQTQFWSDLVLQGLSTHAKLLAVYLLTGPHTNMLGCFRLPAGYVSEDLKWNGEIVSEVFAELARVGFLIRDAESGWIFIYHFLEWNPIENPNQGKSLSKLCNQVPQQSRVFKPLVESLLTQTKYLDEGFRNRLETLCQAFRNQEQEQEQDQKQDQDQDQGKNQKQDVVDGKPSNDDLPSSNDSKAPLVIPKKLVLVPCVTKRSSVSARISIPLQNDETFLVSDYYIENWRKTYPNIDVLQELRQLRAWNEANPAERKTSSHILRHINAWLAKEQRIRLQQQQAPPVNSAMDLATRGLSPTLAHNLIVGEQWLTRPSEKKQTNHLESNNNEEDKLC